MCGITGVIKDFSDPSKIDLVRLSEIIKHRGPDEFGEYQDRLVALSTRRLSIVDVLNGHQPYFNEKKNVIVVFNGQIYNYKYLQSLVKKNGHELNSNSDGEVIAHLYEDFGCDFISKLDGMFAIAIWDKQSEELLLYRDRVGKKPILYGFIGKLFHFSSEIKTFDFLSRQNINNIDKSSLVKYLTFGYIPNPGTIFGGINKLAPGHYLRLNKFSQITIVKYWEPTLESSNHVLSIKTFEDIFSDAILKRIPDERSFGCFLSGGIDSSLVALKTSQLLKRSIKTFSIGFEDSQFDESKYSKYVSNYIKSEHKHLTLDDSLVPYYFNKVINSYDEPFGDSSALATIALSEFASKDIVVALSGDGGDEVFGGYKRYVYMNKLKNFDLTIDYLLKDQSKEWAIKKSFLNMLVNFIGVQRVTANNPLYFNMIHQLGTLNVSYLLKSDLLDLKNSALDFFDVSMSSMTSNNSVQKSNLYDFLHYLPDDLLYKIDIASMSASLEVRCPFLDFNLIQMGLCLSDSQKYSKSGKRLLKEYALKYFPRDFVFRPKMGFGVPKTRWMKEILLEDVKDTFLSADSLIYSYLQPQRVKLIYDEFLDDGKHENTIWNLLIFEKWARRWITN